MNSAAPVADFLRWTCAHCEQSCRGPFLDHVGRRSCRRHPAPPRADGVRPCCERFAGRPCTRCDHVPRELWALATVGTADATLRVPAFVLRGNSVAAAVSLPPAAAAADPADALLWRDVERLSRLEPAYWASLPPAVLGAARVFAAEWLATDGDFNREPRVATWLPPQPLPEAPPPARRQGDADRAAAVERETAAARLVRSAGDALAWSFTWRAAEPATRALAAALADTPVASALISLSDASPCHRQEAAAAAGARAAASGSPWTLSSRSSAGF